MWHDAQKVRDTETVAREHEGGELETMDGTIGVWVGSYLTAVLFFAAM